MTFDECVGQVRAAEAGALVEGTRDGYTYWDWPFLQGASVSYFTRNYTDPVQQNGWGLAGHTCRPMQADGHYGVTYNHDECLKNVIREPTEEQCANRFGHSHLWECPVLVGSPRAMPYLGWNADPVYYDMLGSGLNCDISSSTCMQVDPCECMCFFRDPRVGLLGMVNYQCASPGPTAARLWAKVMANAGDSVCDFAKTNSPFQCVKDMPGLPESAREAADLYAREYPADVVCAPLKTNAPFQCIKDMPGLPETADQAAKMYSSRYTADVVCAPLKTNAPFQCTRTDPIDTLQVVSLAYANTMLVYSLAAALFASMLYRCAKEASTQVRDEEEGSGVKGLDPGSSSGSAGVSAAEIDMLKKQVEAQAGMLGAQAAQLEAQAAQLASLQGAVFAQN